MNTARRYLPKKTRDRIQPAKTNPPAVDSTTETQQASEASTMAPSAPTSLLDLPPEIRFLIWERLLASYLSEPIRIAKCVQITNRSMRHFRTFSFKTGQHYLSPFNLELVRMNKTISQEILALLYGATFEFDHCHVLEEFLDRIGSNRKLLRHISISDPRSLRHRSCVNSVTQVFDKLRDAHDLRSFRVAHGCMHLREQKEGDIIMWRFLDAAGPFLRLTQRSLLERKASWSVMDIFQVLHVRPGCWRWDARLRELVKNGCLAGPIVGCRICCSPRMEQHCEQAEVEFQKLLKKELVKFKLEELPSAGLGIGEVRQLLAKESEVARKRMHQ